MSTRYLAELRHELRRLPEADRDDAVREIESHIAEAEANGEPAAAVLARLGSARTLAGAYVADFYLQAPHQAWSFDWALVRVSAYLVGSGVVSLIVVPFLAIMAATFGLTALVTPGVGLLQLAGLIPDNQGVVYWGEPVAREWVLPLTLTTGFVCAALAWAAYRLLRRYATAVLAGYRKLRPSAAA
jgi:uncharacterized membrane protein